MIPNNTIAGKVTSNVGDVETVAMSINVDAMPYLMQLLTNLYSDEELACIREYSTNARDAHFDAGTMHLPIEVNTPSPLSPFLSIKDYGVGLNKEDIFNLYSQYGASTKREQRETNGTMGVGSKSALAYTSQFTVVGIKEGVRTMVLVSRDERGIGHMQIMGEDITDEPNGVEIQIPAKRNHSFQEKAEEFFKYWEEGSVLLNGKEPKRNFTPLTDRIYFHDGDEDVIVMGNVAYPLEFYRRISRATNRRVACFVTMNGDDEVVFTPSREALVYDEITTNVLAGLQEEFNAAIKTFIKESIDAANTHKEAFDAYYKMRDIFGSLAGNSFTWKDEAVDVGKYLGWFDEENNWRIRYFMTFHTKRHRYAVDTRVSVNLDALRRSPLVITGFDKGTLSSNYKTRIRQYLNNHRIARNGMSAVVLTSHGSLSLFGQWVEAAVVNTVSWKTLLEETKPPKRERSAPVERDGAYDVMTKDSKTYQQMDLNDGDNIVYYTIADYGRYGIDSTYAEMIFAVEPDVKLVCVGGNRVGKLTRLYSNVREFDAADWRKRYDDSKFAELTDEEIEFLKVRHQYRNDGDWGRQADGSYGYTNYGIDGSKVPEKYLDMLDDVGYARTLRVYHAKHRVPDLGHSESLKAVLDTVPDPVDWTKKYPLANWSDFPKQTVDYINMIYRAKNKEN